MASDDPPRRVLAILEQSRLTIDDDTVHDLLLEDLTRAAAERHGGLLMSVGLGEN